MKILIVPMFALSRMGGPWSRAQRIASAFIASGHDVAIGIAADGNCGNPVVPDVLELPVPSPLGLPMAISSRTFPLASKLGIAGRKPVRSFEEVLWLTGALAYDYEADSVGAIRRFIRSERPDVVYSEFSLPAVIAAQAEGVPCVGTVSYPTQPSYASDPAKAKGVRRLLAEFGLAPVTSSLELFERLERRFVPSCAKLEPIEGDGVVFCGFLSCPTERTETTRDCIVVYMGTGSVPKSTLKSAAKVLAEGTDLSVYVAGMDGPPCDEGNLHFAKSFDFCELLPRARVFVNHGGQNSVMDALTYGVPQVICPGNVFERRFNAQSIASAGAAIQLDNFTETALRAAVTNATESDSIAMEAITLRDSLLALGGVSAIVAETEGMLARRKALAASTL
ncbi:MAG: glycosyltransferase [Coriobacteriales bacterium]|nr:glycosyltransferase [Coriobacteriales bacterium]